MRREWKKKILLVAVALAIGFGSPIFTEAAEPIQGKQEEERISVVYTTANEDYRIRFDLFVDDSGKTIDITEVNVSEVYGWFSINKQEVTCHMRSKAADDEIRVRINFEASLGSGYKKEGFDVRLNLESSEVIVRAGIKNPGVESLQKCRDQKTLRQ